MKSKHLTTPCLILSLLLSAGIAQAEEPRNNSAVHQNLSKRPYQEPSADTKSSTAEQWEGATLIKDESVDDKSGPTKYQQFRIRMLGQRPYMDGK